MRTAKAFGSGLLAYPARGGLLAGGLTLLAIGARYDKLVDVALGA